MASCMPEPEKTTSRAPAVSSFRGISEILALATSTARPPSSPTSIQSDEQQARLFEAITSTTPDFVFVYDLQGRFVYVNRRLLEVWGMELENVVGKTCLELGYEQWLHDKHMSEIAEVIQTRKSIKGEVPFTAPRTIAFGRRRPFEANATLTRRIRGPSPPSSPDRRMGFQATRNAVRGRMVG